ncbi:MAG: hypothetical protein IH924_11145, partial [Proteobacteria bacterium]|nr:hypothetical protein [Pseudomonadota bacterium]
MTYFYADQPPDHQQLAIEGVALQAVRDSSDEILQERLILARTVASAVDRAVTTTATLVTGVAETIGRSGTDIPAEAEISVKTLALALTDVNAGTPPELVALIDGGGRAIARVGAAGGLPVGPPSAGQRDSHANIGGFQHEA